MRVLGYVDVHTNDTCHQPGLWFDHGRIRDEPESNGSPCFVTVALVPVADLDVEQAVERAAVNEYLTAFTSSKIKWPDASDGTRSAYRDRVRPIVLAALGVES